MNKAIRLYKRDGIRPVLEALAVRVNSILLKKKYAYPHLPMIDFSTTWLTGEYAQIGKGFSIGKRCRIEVIDEHNGVSYIPRLIIGDNVSINDDVHIGCIHKVVIGDNVLMASKIYISDHNHGSYKGDNQSSAEESPSNRLLSYDSIIIGANTWIGEMVSILPGVTIGEGCIIGANSVVTHSIPSYVIAVGIPAKPIKEFDFSEKKWVALKSSTLGAK